MCPHRRFEIIHYESGIMIRRCHDCGQVELRTERWVDMRDLNYVLNQANAESGALISKGVA